MKSELKKEKKEGTQKEKPSKKVIIIALAVVLVVIAVVVSGGVKSNQKVNPLYDKDGKPVYISDNEVNYIYSSADQYKGKFIKLTGQVFNADKQDGVTVLQINVDTKNHENNTNTFIYYNGNTDIKGNDYINVTGYIGGMLEYKNMMGTTMSAPIIYATELNKASYIEAVSPTIKETSYTDKVIDQHGYKVEITKVEFAKDETRLYVTATNNGSADFSIYSFSGKILQNGKQYDESSNFEAHYPQLQSDLKPGVSSSGVIVYPTIEQSNFSFTIDGYCDDYNIDIEDYNFELNVE